MSCYSSNNNNCYISLLILCNYAVDYVISCVLLIVIIILKLIILDNNCDIIVIFWSTILTDKFSCRIFTHTHTHTHTHYNDMSINCFVILLKHSLFDRNSLVIFNIFWKCWIQKLFEVFLFVYKDVEKLFLCLFVCVFVRVLGYIYVVALAQNITANTSFKTYINKSIHSWI